MLPLTILVMEDDALMGAALSQALSGAGHEVVLVADEAAALEAIDEWPVDVVLSDIDDAADCSAVVEALPESLQGRVVFLADPRAEPIVPDGAILLRKPSRGVALRAAVERAAAA